MIVDPLYRVRYGRGAKRYWNHPAAIWNHAPPEYAYLRKPDGTLMSKWIED